MSEEVRSIQRSGTRTPRKPKKSQIPYGLTLVIIIIAIGVALGYKSGNLAMFWIFGLGFGFVLQKSRFCFTASFRDPWITGSTSITKGLCRTNQFCYHYWWNYVWNRHGNCRRMCIRYPDESGRRLYDADVIFGFLYCGFSSRSLSFWFLEN